MSFDDQAAANRLIQQIQDVMAVLGRWKQKMGESNDVLDDMMKTYLKHQVAIEILNKKQSDFYDALNAKQGAFMAQQNKLQQGLYIKAKLRSAEQDKQTQAVKERHAAYFAMQKEMVDYRHSFKDFDAGLNLLSSAMKGSLGGAGVAIAGIQGGKGIMDSTARERISQENLGDAMNDLFEFQKKHGHKNLKLAKHKDLRDRKQILDEARDRAGDAHEKAQSGFLYQMGQQQLGGKSLSDRLGGIADFLKRHKLGVFLALGSMVVLGAIIKKAMDSSPMFGQMLKLWKFAIMMIFRPLGDFFGFFFRPILVLLLRKFIIPWYTTMYPVMIKLGNDLGIFVAGFIDWFTDVGAKIIGFFAGLGTGTFDVNSLVAMLIGTSTTGKNIGDTFIDIFTAKLIPSAFADNGNKVLSNSWDLFFGAISTILDTMRPFVVSAITFVGNVAKWLVSEGAKVVKWGWETIKAQMPFIKSVFAWLKEQAPNIKILFETFMTSLTWIKNKWTQLSTHLTNAEIWLNAAVNNISTLPSRIWAKLLSVPEELRKGLLGVVSALFDHLERIPIIGGAFKDFRKNHLGFANGGRITEPIFGVGRSGQTYSFGEKGSETITPDGKGTFTGGITINIQNMSGSQQDLNNLRQTILSVVQEANTRRGRI